MSELHLILLKLRECIDFSLAEKRRIIDDLPSLSQAQTAEFLDILRKSQQRRAELARKYPERIERDVERACVEWDEVIGSCLPTEIIREKSVD